MKLLAQAPTPLKDPCYAARDPRARDERHPAKKWSDFCCSWEYQANVSQLTNDCIRMILFFVHFCSISIWQDGRSNEPVDRWNALKYGPKMLHQRTYKKPDIFSIPWHLSRDHFHP